MAEQPSPMEIGAEKVKIERFDGISLLELEVFGGSDELTNTNHV